jgi:hypothetical protein
MAGLGGLGSIRLPGDAVSGGPVPEDIEDLYPTIDIDLDEDDPVDHDRATKIENADGSVVVYIGPPRIPKEETDFDDNLAEVIPESTLNGIADDLLRLIDSDNQSRREWLETRARGMEMLGFRIEAMRSNGSDGSAPLEGQSQIRATLLAEAVVRFGANAFAELVPVDGPAKVTEDTSGASPALDDLADALERDLNHYLTVVDKPWVPDTDAMLPRVGLDGSVFKKVSHDPILRRPVSRAVYGDDLIVNNSATSLYDAGRITHRVFMRKSMIRRMQIVGAYRDIDITDPGYQEKFAPEMQVEQISGVRKNENNWDQDDRDHEIFETYCELDLPGFEHETDGEPDGLAVPYKVAIHKESRQILDLRRNWNDGDELCLPKTFFVQYCFIRGFGFYGIGLSHLLGNMTNGITAAYREMVDAGMYANFPGALLAKGAARQNNNILRVPPGGSAEIETGGMPIQQVAMPLPYKSPDAVWVQFVQQLNAEGKSLGGTAEIMVGEGRQDAPVGTTLALIEQAIKPLLATHKRLCAAQGDELQLLCERFREDPESFWRGNKRPATTWDEQLFIQALNANEIVARADPNTASHLQRMLRNAALYQMAKDDPTSFNVTTIRRICIRGIGFANPDQFLSQNPTPPPPDPKAQAAMIGAQADMLDAQTKAGQLQLDARNAPMEAQRSQMDSQAKIATAKMNLQKQQLATHTASLQARNEAQKPALEERQRQFDAGQNQADRQLDLVKQARDHQHELQLETGGWVHEQNLAERERQGEMQREAMGHLHERQIGQMDTQREAMGLQHEAAQGAMDRQHEADQGARQQQFDAAMGERDRIHESQEGERTRAHDERTAAADREGRMRETRAKVRDTSRPTGTTHEHRTGRAHGGIVNDEMQTPYGTARRAPDGEFYVRHPRTGSYFRIRKRAS